MDVGMNHFETVKAGIEYTCTYPSLRPAFVQRSCLATTVYTLLDAPGHRDFVQSTVSGIAQVRQCCAVHPRVRNGSALFIVF